MRENEQELILKIGAAGGSLSVWSLTAKDGTRSFVVKTNETTLKDFMTKEDAAGINFKSKTGQLPSFADALNVLGRHLWHRMTPLFVHEDFIEIVFKAVESRWGKRAAKQWREKADDRRSRDNLRREKGSSPGSEQEVNAISHIWSDEEIKSLKLLFNRITDKLQDEESLKEARVVAKLLTEINPSDPQASYSLGLLNGALGDFVEAEKNTRKSIEMGGDKFPNYVQMSSILMDQGNFKEALEWCLRALKCKPADVFIHHRIADICSLDGDNRRAIKFLEPLLKISSLTGKDKYATLLRLGHLCIFTQHIKKALQYFRAAIELDPSDESVWGDVGHCLSRLGDNKDAIPAFQKAVYLNPSAENLYNLGDAYVNLGYYDHAIVPLMKATRQKPDHYLAYYDLALAFAKMNKYREGAAAAIAALRADPEMKTQQINLGLGAMDTLGFCLMHMDRHEEALVCFRRNVKLLSESFFNIGWSLFKMKRYKEALPNFVQALDGNPSDHVCLNYIGQIHMELEEYKVAEKYLKKSLKIAPNYAISHYDLGVLLSRMKNRQAEALRCFNKAITLNPDMEWAYYTIACLYAISGKTEEALKYLKQSLEKGLRAKDHIDADQDMDILREEKEFKELMAEYFHAETTMN
jgi:tetratricopeptide (TPR) repeat protein